MNFTPCSADYNDGYREPVFYEAEDGRVFIDATCFLQTAPTKDCELTIDDFLNKFSYLIDCLCQTDVVNPEDLPMQNPENGHAMLPESLELLLLQYMDPKYVPYLLERMSEMHNTGFAVSDRFIAIAAQERFGTPT